MTWVTDKWSTHQSLLIWAVANTTGPVLELGTGGYSTPILHLLCGNKRKLVSVDNNDEYLTNFGCFISENHDIIRVSDWPQLDLLHKKWDVVFVDHAPAEDREPVLQILSVNDMCKYIVVHDTELGRYYGYDRVFPLFKYSVTCKWQPKWTTILSMDDPMIELKALLGEE